MRAFEANPMLLAISVILSVPNIGREAENEEEDADAAAKGGDSLTYSVGVKVNSACTTVGDCK